MNSYLKLTVIILGLIAPQFSANAQQDPQFTQYYFNPLTINSGYAGTRDAMSINLALREQWLGIDGRPRTQSLSVHTPIGTSNVSLGASVIADQHGPVKSTYTNLDVAYAVKVTENSKLSFGLKSGLHFYRANLSGLETKNDVSFQQNVRSSALPNFGVSAYWYATNHFIGLSAPRLIENNFYVLENSLEAPLEKRHLFLTAGKVFTLSPTLKLKPTFLVKYVEAAPVSMDISVNLLIQEKLWVGTFLRFKDAVGMMVSYQINDNIRLGYSYDKTISQFSGNGGSHEILINYDLKLEREKSLSPRYF